jgi:hypothetical protein
MVYDSLIKSTFFTLSIVWNFLNNKTLRKPDLLPSSGKKEPNPSATGHCRIPLPFALNYIAISIMNRI